jgi:transcriptional regulator with XRE-family HTH domain
MGDTDPYKHIRALALSIANIEKQIGIEAEAQPLAVPEVPPVATLRPAPAIGTFTERLRSVRERRGLTQRELGRLAAVPQSHISKIESGAVDLRLSSLLAIAEVLDLELVLVDRTRSSHHLPARDAAVETQPIPVREPLRVEQPADDPTSLTMLREGAVQ